MRKQPGRGPQPRSSTGGSPPSSRRRASPRSTTRARRAASCSTTRFAGVELVVRFDGPVIDVGSGGGTPGIPLAAALPSRPVTLLEAERRKCDVPRSVDGRRCRTSRSSGAGRRSSRSRSTGSPSRRRSPLHRRRSMVPAGSPRVASPLPRPRRTRGRASRLAPSRRRARPLEVRARTARRGPKTRTWETRRSAGHASRRRRRSSSRRRTSWCSASPRATRSPSTSARRTCHVDRTCVGRVRPPEDRRGPLLCRPGASPARLAPSRSTRRPGAPVP